MDDVSDSVRMQQSRIRGAGKPGSCGRCAGGDQSHTRASPYAGVYVHVKTRVSPPVDIARRARESDLGFDTNMAVPAERSWNAGLDSHHTHTIIRTLLRNSGAAPTGRRVGSIIGTFIIWQIRRRPACLLCDILRLLLIHFGNMWMRNTCIRFTLKGLIVGDPPFAVSDIQANSQHLWGCPLRWGG